MSTLDEYEMMSARILNYSDKDLPKFIELLNATLNELHKEWEIRMLRKPINSCVVFGGLESNIDDGDIEEDDMNPIYVYVCVEYATYDLRKALMFLINSVVEIDDFVPNVIVIIPDRSYQFYPNNIIPPVISPPYGFHDIPENCDKLEEALYLTMGISFHIIGCNQLEEVAKKSDLNVI